MASGPAYRIETSRLVLVPPSPELAEKAKRAEDESREHLRTFMLWADRQPETIDDTIAKLRQFRAAFEAGTDMMYLAFRGDEIVGGTGLHARVGKGGLEIGYWVHSAHVRRGLATEIAGALTRVAFEVHEARWVEIRTAKANVASAGVPPKLGYRHEATLAQRLEVPGQKVDDALVFTLLASEYLSSPAHAISVSAFDAVGRRLF
jgi:RimJ/RimL family protein N-acetyltransferase